MKKIALFVLVAMVAGLGVSTAHAKAGKSASYYGLYVTDGSTVLGELDCAWPKASACGPKPTNIVARVYDSPNGDLQRVSGKWADRKSNGRKTYVRIDYYASAQTCVSGGGGVNVSSGPGASLSTQLCSSWTSLNVTRSTPHYDGSSMKSFTLEKVFGPAVNSQRAAVRVCQDNALWFADTCSGNRLLTVNV